jgi:hypothetical protein
MGKTSPSDEAFGFDAYLGVNKETPLNTDISINAPPRGFYLHQSRKPPPSGSKRLLLKMYHVFTGFSRK